MGAFALLLVLGLLAPADALAVFSNPGPIAVGAMFILSAALDRCGAIDVIAGGLTRLPKMSLRTVLPAMILVVAFASAFVNNTPVVIVFLPVVLSLAQRMQVPASKLLIPLSYASIFGGSCTLIGTSTNIIVSSMAVQAGYSAFGMFELAVIGIPLLIAGTLFLTIFGPRLLPVRETLSSILTEAERREYLIEAFVDKKSPLIGKTLEEVTRAGGRRLRILEILRRGVRLNLPGNEAILQAGDRLLLSMSPKVAAGVPSEGLDLRDALGEGLTGISLSEGVLIEAVLGANSDLVGEALRNVNFRQRYRLAPLAIHRRGRNMRDSFDRITLEHGDTLLLLGTTEAVDQLRGGEDLIVLDKPAVASVARRQKLPLILGVIAGVVVAASVGIMPIAPAAIIGCVLLLLTGCVTTKEAYEAIHWPILFLIFGMLGVGAAMESTGTSAWLGQQLVASVSTFVSEPWQPFALLVGIYLLTSILTEVLSNNAVAVLLTSVAIGLAQMMEIDPRPFLMAIAIAASASFATPIGYQTNTYVYGVGGYRFSDFARIGIPLNFVAFIVSMIVIPLFWSF